MMQLLEILCFRKSFQSCYLHKNPDISHKASQLTTCLSGNTLLFCAANACFLWASLSAKLLKGLSSSNRSLSNDKALTLQCRQVFNRRCNQVPTDIQTSGLSQLLQEKQSPSDIRAVRHLLLPIVLQKHPTVPMLNTACLCSKKQLTISCHAHQRAKRCNKT